VAGGGPQPATGGRQVAFRAGRRDPGGPGRSGSPSAEQADAGSRVVESPPTEPDPAGSDPAGSPALRRPVVGPVTTHPVTTHPAATRTAVVRGWTARSGLRIPHGPRVAGCTGSRPAVRPVTLVVALVVAAVVAALLLLVGGVRSGAIGDGAVPSRTTVEQVRPGETLWDLARRVAPSAPPDQVVARIRELNGMSASGIYPGLPLIVPDGH
jgi:hypothetical protein